MKTTHSSALLALVALTGCGARTTLDDAAASGGNGSSNRDPCPSRIAGPKAITGSCSTRDGRARVEAPKDPHVTWTSKLPVDETGSLGLGAVATDASAHAYVVTGDNIDDMGSIRRLRVTDGAFDWTIPIAPDSATGMPLVLPEVIDLYAYDSGSIPSILAIDPIAGTYQATTFGIDLFAGAGDAAVGSDGSLFLVHQDGVGTAHTSTFISRVHGSGMVDWSSVDLSTLGPPAGTGDGELTPSLLALAGGDLVVVAAGVLTKSGEVAVVHGLEPDTGAIRWTTSLAGDRVGGPVVLPDGKLALLLQSGGTSSLVIVAPEDGAPSTIQLWASLFQIFAVTRDGVLIVGTDAGNGIDGIAALTEGGDALWEKPMQVKGATIAADGTIITFGKGVTAIDPATGVTGWDLGVPSTGACIIDAALTSEGGLVGLQCDGTLFGAAD